MKTGNDTYVKIGGYISVGSMKLDHWFNYNLHAETIQNRKTDGRSSRFNKPATSVICTRSYITCNNNLHKTKTSCKHVQQSGAKKSDTDSLGKEMSVENSETRRPTGYSYH
jgi:hypothetical protein